MSWSILDVKSDQNTGAGTIQLLAFAVNPQAGDLIIVPCSNWNSTPARALLTPTDNIGGNTYTPMGAQLAVSASGQIRAWYCFVTNGGSGFRVTGSSTSTTAEIAVMAWLLRESNGAPASNGDYKTNVQAATANPSSGTTTPSPATGSLFFACMSNADNTTVTDPSGWNAIANGFDSTMLAASRLPDNVAHQDLFSAYKLSNTAENVQWTQAADSWAVAAISFKPGLVISAALTGTALA